MTKNILMIDDDTSLVELVREYLEQHEINILEANTPEAGFIMLQKHSPELILLDVMLPGKTGFEICKEIRRTSDVPIIMLTARGSVIDRILGLELGADDYLPKPFEPRELLARIVAILRRGRGPAAADSNVLHYEDLSVDVSQRTVILKGKPIAMTTTEFDLLTLFAGRPNETLNRDQISLHLRGTEWEAVSRSVDAVMSRLRQKLEDDPKHPRFFRTIWGTGYMFIAKAK
ncbi:MAG: response regulator transcription factor [Proteobacteria bacterium]|nr:MAG: response regulator transcription factor [Pseudomonadota bacterium]